MIIHPSWPEDYAWSSCRATAGLSPEPAFFHSDWILAQLAGERGEARRRYMEFVRAGIGCWKIGEALKSNAISGGHEFMAKLGPGAQEQIFSQGDPEKSAPSFPSDL